MKRDRTVPETEVSWLTASGGTVTSEKAVAWAASTAAEISEIVGSTSCRAHLWCYRDPEDCVVLDVWSEWHDVALTLRIAGVLDLSGGRQILVPDAIEALHLAGLVLALLGIRPSVGRGAS